MDEMRKQAWTRLTRCLIPVYQEDASDWRYAASVLVQSAPKVFWYGSAGSDLRPLLALCMDGLPTEVISSLGNHSVYLMSDYSSYYFDLLYNLYDNLDNIDSSALLDELSEVPPRSLHIPSAGISEVRTTINEMIPLTCNLLPQQPESCGHFKQFSESQWHFVYISVRIKLGDHYFDRVILYALVENLYMWEQVLRPIKMPVDTFMALRVGGHSGSWVDVHNPAAAFMQSISQSPPHLRPRYWIADRTWYLEQIWDPGYLWLIGPNEQAWRCVFPYPAYRDGYGLPQTFRCDWDVFPASE